MPKRQPVDIARLRQVATLYYREGLTREKIAERLGIERRNVSKMLEEAEKLGVVRIDIPETVLDCGPAYELQQKFPHLQEIIVLPSLMEGEEYGGLLRRWGVAAATYFDKLVGERHELHVGITGGETLFEFCEAVTTQRRENVHIHTTALVGRGRLLPTASHIDPLVNAALLWAKCGRIGGHIHYATVPPYDGMTRDAITKELDELAKRQPIREAIEDMDKINVAFLGLGLVQPPKDHSSRVNLSKLTMTGLLQPVITPGQLAGEGAIGDLSNCFFDENGNGDKWRFFLTAGHYDPERQGVKFFRRMVEDGKEVVLIAGELKHDALLPALKARLFSAWITDQESLNYVADAAAKEF